MYVVVYCVLLYSFMLHIRMLSAYETAADWSETKAMDGAFAALSWDDSAVKAAMPEYLNATGEDRAKAVSMRVMSIQFNFQRYDKCRNIS